MNGIDDQKDYDFARLDSRLNNKNQNQNADSNLVPNPFNKRSKDYRVNENREPVDPKKEAFK